MRTIVKFIDDVDFNYKIQVAVIASNFELAEMIQNYTSDDIGEFFLSSYCSNYFKLTELMLSCC